MQELHIKSAELDEIELGFFENFPFLMDFDARDNLCVNASIQNVQSIDFFVDVTLHECFANWFVPRESTTVIPPVSDDGNNLAVNGILMGIFVIFRFVIC
jgi:hypothetical protein